MATRLALLSVALAVLLPHAAGQSQPPLERGRKYKKGIDFVSKCRQQYPSGGCLDPRGGDQVHNGTPRGVLAPCTLCVGPMRGPHAWPLALR